MKLKKRSKAGRMRGSSRHGWGARKKHISSGHRGGYGMAGTGKMAGHKYSLLQKLYPGEEYLGKQGITSRSTKKRINDVMNLVDLELNLASLKKKHEKNGVLDLSGYKILGEGELKTKVTIRARAASKSAIEKIEKAGGKFMLSSEQKPAAVSKEKAEAKEEKKEDKPAKVAKKK